LQLPKPEVSELPSAFADRIGRVYVGSVSDGHKRSLGQYFTPLEVARFMAGQVVCDKEKIRALDPAAGAGVLACALCEALAAQPEKPSQITLEAYETDRLLADCLEVGMLYAKQWLRERGIVLEFKVRREDFVLANAENLSGTSLLFPPSLVEDGDFDVIICNPPYFKLPKSDPRARVAASVVWGQPNIYAIFMAISAEMLRNRGEMVFITPRSYAAGNYFQLFRERFFARMRPEAIHLFDSRYDTFSRDEVLQESVILRARRDDNWWRHVEGNWVAISRSIGVRDLASSRCRLTPLADVVDVAGKDKVLRIPLADQDDEIVRLVRSWKGSLHRYGMEISTGPVVPFRAVPLICQAGDVPETHAPLLWMQNVQPMRVDWPVDARRKAQFILDNQQSQALLVKNSNYVLLRRFSAKEAARRLIAAPFLASQINSHVVGLENHLNYVHRPRGSLSEDEAYGLAALFNSRLIDGYFRTFNGNTQVSATELRAMPLPPLETIKVLGQRTKELGADLAAIDSLVEECVVEREGKLDDES
jgi:adenine-specific DNA-methyltransferase